MEQVERLRHRFDELLPGLPSRWDSQPRANEDRNEMLQRMAAGYFSDLNLPQPASFPTPAEVQQEA